MSADVTDGPTLGEVLHDSLRDSAPAAFGRPVSDFATWDRLPPEKQERMEIAAADVGAHAVARYAVQAVKAAPGETVVISPGAGVTMDQARRLQPRLAALAPGVHFVIVADIHALRVWHPDDAPAELRAAMAETRAMRELVAELLGEFSARGGDGFRARLGAAAFNRYCERGGVIPKGRTAIGAQS